MKWVDAVSLGKAGFVQTRLYGKSRDVPSGNEVGLAEIAKYGEYFYSQFTWLAPKEVRWNYEQSKGFNTLEEAKAYTVAILGLS